MSDPVAVALIMVAGGAFSAIVAWLATRRTAEQIERTAIRRAI